MVADEAEANFDELDMHEEDESSGIEEDEKVTPWSAITDNGETPDGNAMKIKKFEEEVMMVAFNYNVMTYRKYCDEQITEYGSV